ncbi:MAG: hypothetical protein MUC92_01325 [Fimbriimonadaceae bacterium]|jgi:hypothetical protein|nr:hypothetical protein [Fimbriimonadaceae bacterium]
MITTFVWVATQNNVVELTLKGIEAAYQRLASAEIRATLRSDTLEGKANIRYHLAYRRPGKFRLTVDPGDTKGKTVFVDGKRINVLVHRSNQLAPVPVSNEQPLATTIQSQDRFIDPLFLHIANGVTLSEWLEPIRAVKGWRLTWKGNEGRLHFKGGASDLELRFNQNLLLTRLNFRNGDQKTEWNLVTRPLEPANLVPPASANRVREIDKAFIPPTYGDPQARSLTQRMLATYDRMRAARVTVVEGGKRTEFSFGNGRAWQRDEVAEWSYSRDGVRINVPGQKLTFSGKADWSQTIDAVATVGSRVDPFLRAWVRGQNPIRQILGRGVKVETMGQAEVNGEPVTILKVTSSGVTTDLYVRPRDGMVLGLATILAEGQKRTQIDQKTFIYGTGAGRSLTAPAGFTARDVRTVISPDSLGPVSP